MPPRERELYQPCLTPTLTPRDIYSELDQFVVGQEAAKRTLAIAAYNHFKRITTRKKPPIRKSNILLVGPTGSGKTLLATRLAEVLGLPLALTNATEYTEVGYHGRDVELMVSDLLQKAHGNPDAAGRGIVFIDEFDKLARRGSSGFAGATRDIGGSGVQQSLLKLLEGTLIFVPRTPYAGDDRQDFVSVDTTNILFVCAGTFSTLERKGCQSIGFTSGASLRTPRIEPSDLVDYGLLLELVGRLPVIVETLPLSEDDLVDVLTKPPDAILKEYQSLLAVDSIEITYDKPAVRRMAKEAAHRGTGARALRSIVEAVMRNIMFDAPERSGETIRITAGFVESALTRTDET